MRFISLITLIFMSFDLSAHKPENSPYLALLKRVLHERKEWVKVHAAEYLVWAGHPEEVREVFLEEERLYGQQPPYRIGIWRVLAQASPDEASRNIWTGKIRQAFLDPDGPDRLHAAETLAKLRICAYDDNPLLTEQTLSSEKPALALYTLWSMCYRSAEQFQAYKKRLLNSIKDSPADASSARSIPAYALRQMGEITDAGWKIIATAALNEPEVSPAKIYLLSAAWVLQPEKQPVEKEVLLDIYRKLLPYATSDSKAERSELAMALAEKGLPEDLALLESIFTGKHPLPNEADEDDVRAAAAYALLKRKS